MFVPNTEHQNDFLKIWSVLLSEEKLERLKSSSGYSFYRLIFCNIKEEDFRVLYSSKYSSPNCAVNCLVAALFQLHHHNWSYAELMSQIDFNVEIRVALGLKDLESRPFTKRTLFNFKNRLANHSEKHGENLLEKVFDYLTAHQLKELKIKTNIQRGDSVLLDTNIRTYSRLSFLVEVVSRVGKILDKSDQVLYSALFNPYLKGGEKFIYSLQEEEGSPHLETLAQTYYGIHTLLNEKYSEHPVFQMFDKVYSAHFKEVESEEAYPIMLRPKEELGSDNICSPDDLDATCRTKRGETHIGFVAFGAETCHPENELNLVTKVALETNNTDDSKILEAQLDEMVECTPDLEEFHIDGGFGSEGVDVKADEHQIILIQTAIKGVQSQVPMGIEGTEQDGFTVDCPNPEHPKVKAQKLQKNYRADFDLDKCEQCPFKDFCPTKRERKYRKKIAILRFKLPDVLRHKRHKAIQQIPKERQTLRPGVENLMARFRRGEKHTGKFKITGRFNFESYLFAMACVVNFERIFAFQKAISDFFTPFWSSKPTPLVSCQRTFILNR